MAIRTTRASSSIRKNDQRRRLLRSTAVRAVEALEPRQLLSSVVTTYPIPSPDPTDYYGSGKITAGPDGNMWFADTSDNAIGKVTPGGQVTLYPLPVHNVSDDDGTGDVSPDDPEPLDIVTGPNGNLWFTESGVDRIGEITPAGKITEFQTPSPDSYPEGLAVGSDGNLWFAETGNNIIGKITPGGKITEYPLSTLQTDVDGLVEGSDGKIWFIAHDQNYDGVIASISPSGTVQSYSLDSAGNSEDPTALAAGPDGNLWVGTDSGVIEQVTTAGAVTAFSIPSSDSVTTIEPGTNNTLWLALSGNDQFGEITTDGVVSTFSLPSSGADSANANIYMSDLVEGAGGTLWFADNNTAQVGTIDLTDALLASSADVSVTAGSAQTSTFASFVDFAGGSDASDYTATVTLSDGTVIDGTITANSTGGFDVTASNTWTIGYDTATVTITDTRDASRIATTTDTIDAAAPDATGTGIDVSAVAGQVFSGTVATFSGVAVNSLSSYSATIDWGDGHSTTGTITANNSNGFDVAGTHSYAASGSFAVTTTLSPYPSFGLYPIGIDPIPVQPGGPIVPIDPVNPIAPISKVISPPIGVVGGSGTVVGSTGATPGVSVSTPTSGSTISSTGLSNTLSSVYTGTIKLSAPTTKAIDVPITPSAEPLLRIGPPIGDGSATATSTATIAAGAMQGTGYSVFASTSQTFNDVVADFTLANATADLSHFHATVTWNDPGIANWWYQLSIAPTAGVITADGNGGFTVATSASFTNGGLYHFVVTITDDRLGTGDASQVGAAYGQVIVDSPIVWLPIAFAGAPTAAGVGTSNVVSQASNPVLSEKPSASGITINAVAGQSFSGKVGTLRGLYSGTSPSGLHGTIHWGDGTTSAATFTGGKRGIFTVHGAHIYTQGGSDTVSVDVTQPLANQGASASLYPLHLPMVESSAKVSAPHTVITTGGIPITASAGVAFSGSVAAFDVPEATNVVRTATIFWGDGTKSTGTITQSTLIQLTITANHTYRKHGAYKVIVQVNQKPSSGSHTKVQSLLARIVTHAVVS